MCKLAYVSKIDLLSDKQKVKLMKVVQDEVTLTERSGYGVAAKNRDGSIDMFRTLNVTQSPLVAENTPEFCESRSLGQINLSTATEIIFHGRTSTNSVSLPNTHPFYIGDTVLCHNGVMQYSGENYEKLTDNDTEDLTFHFDKYGLQNIDKVLSGYAAFIAFKKGQTHIVRDSIAPLYYSYIERLQCHVVATKESTVSKINQTLGAKKAKIFKVLDNTFLVIENNKVKNSGTWQGLKSNSYADSKANLSLGFDYGYKSKYKSTPKMFQDDQTFDESAGWSYYSDEKENLARFFDDETLVYELESGNVEASLDGEKLTSSQYLALDEGERCLVVVTGNASNVKGA